MTPRQTYAALTAITAFAVLSLGLLSFQGGAFDPLGALLALAVPVILWFTVLFLTRTFEGVDAPLLIIVEFLCAVGLIVQYRLRPDTALRQLMTMGGGTACMIVALALVARVRSFMPLRWPIIAGSILFLCVPLAIGQWTNGAKNWFSLAGVSVQPSEFCKLSLVFVLALYLQRKCGRLAKWPLLLFFCGAVGVLVLQRDLGTAVIYAATAILVYFAATSDYLLTGAGLAASAAGGVASYFAFAHVRRRVAAWRNPWMDVDDTGHQIVQGLMAIGSGGVFGLGLGNGAPRAIPAYYTDYVFAVVCEEMGLVIGVMVLTFYALLTVRGVVIALQARDRFRALLALGTTCLLSVQTLLIIGGVIKLIPLTGVTLPFISYGGSSMLSSFLLIGVLQGVSVRSDDQDRSDEKRAALREREWLA